MTDELRRKIKLLPELPGVYVMLDKDNVVIYVGKAKKLKNRVTSYFRNGFKTEKVASMVLNIEDFYYILTPSEADALSLENNLIKKHKPKYNILLKDDKTYPYIKVDLKETFPTFTISRKIKNDGAKYFGPFMLGVSVSDILDIVKEAYGVRPCNTKINLDKPKKECLNYHLGLCASPCSNKCSTTEYGEKVKKAMDFLAGNEIGAEKLLTEKMELAVEREDFERAVVIRDKIKMLSKLKEKKITNISRFITADIIAIKDDGIFSAVSIMFVRSGRTSGVKTFALETLSEGEERLVEFINRYYVLGKEVPDELIICNETEYNDGIEEYLSNLKGKKVEITVPKKGIKYKLLKMAEENAEDYLSRQINKIKHKDDMTIVALKRLQEILNLKKYPRRIECYDISHISGVDKVGSMVVFVDGEKSKEDYRRFKIKTVEGNNDFMSLKEVLNRRLSKLGTIEEDKFPRPDLIIIDGGKGQLTAVSEAFKNYGLDIEYISLAEREEEIFTPYSKEPIILPKSDYCLRLLQRIRDEAHRFAVTFNRALRGKRTLKSILTEIEGIGAKKRNALLDTFKDIPSIKNASIEELMKVNGIGEKHAKKIKEYFVNGSC
ncbi:MAG: excinuclease ABC subunit UvrC [Clostridia bacterium]|nr:excinuclease ABC subunit UvrC [Clostridia bacterium]